jgi:hypothetical protein
MMVPTWELVHSRSFISNNSLMIFFLNAYLIHVPKVTIKYMPNAPS